MVPATVRVAMDTNLCMIKENPDVMQIDATYNCNKFDMPLLHTVGVTCHSTIFNVCFGFIGGKD